MGQFAMGIRLPRAPLHALAIAQENGGNLSAGGVALRIQQAVHTGDEACFHSPGHGRFGKVVHGLRIAKLRKILAAGYVLAVELGKPV